MSDLCDIISFLIASWNPGNCVAVRYDLGMDAEACTLTRFTLRFVLCVVGFLLRLVKDLSQNGVVGLFFESPL